MKQTDEVITAAIYYDEWYPIYDIDMDSYISWAIKVEIPKEKIAEYEKIMKEFKEMQKYLMHAFEKARDHNEKV